MSQHNSAVFNNSCLKVPRNPSNNKPYPIYDQKLIHQLENQARKLSLSSEEDSKKDFNHFHSDKNSLKSFIEFYDSIPEYDDINHLSNKDFYKRLAYLKEKKRSYLDYLHNEIKFENRNTAWVDDYKNLNAGDKIINKPKSKFCSSLALNKTPTSVKNEDVESILSLEKEAVTVKPPSRRSVRIESPTEKNSADVTPDLEYFRSKSRANISSAGSKRNKTLSPYNDSILDDISDLGDCTLTTKSAPSSPRKHTVAWRDCGLTIPKPFQMTVRDEDDKIVEELIIKSKKPLDEQHVMFRAHPVPVESQIPLFDKIMYDQERRRQIIKRRSKQTLKAQMRPFSFTKREEEVQAITKRFSKSSPSLFFENFEKPLKPKQFKAKPVPKNLFSNYIYKKMHEDEFYRALQKKIRSEEMLKAASLPPSMAKREKSKPKYDICPRSYRDIDFDENISAKVSTNKEKYYNLDKELAELELDFIMATPSPKPIKIKTKKKGKKNSRKSSAGSKSSLRSHSALESVNRSNLAAVLRIETARKRMEDEISHRLEEARYRDEARWREKVMRKRPVWQTLAYSHEEDLNMRLQMRRDEERLRKEEHRMRMQSMIGRVNQQPTLFERQSQARFAKTREGLIAKLYKNFGRSSASSKLSSSDSERRSVIEMKDEAIQAHFDDVFKSEEKAAIEGIDALEEIASEENNGNS